jgi:hypothetical protein
MNSAAKTITKNDVDTTPCICCNENISTRATVCKYCQRDQNELYRLVNRIGSFVAILGVAGTIFGTYLAMSSASDAKKDRILAQTSFEKALAIESRVENLVGDLSDTKASLYYAIGDLHTEMQMSVQRELPIYTRVCGDAGGIQSGHDCAVQMASILETMIRVYERHDSIDQNIAKAADINTTVFKKYLCFRASQISPFEYRKYTKLADDFEKSIDDKFLFFENRCKDLN